MPVGDGTLGGKFPRSGKKAFIDASVIDAFVEGGGWGKKDVKVILGLVGVGAFIGGEDMKSSLF